MGSPFKKKKQQMKQLQEQFAQMQQQAESTEHTGSSAGGLINITLDGNKSLKSIKIHPDCVDPDDVEGLETLIKEAFADASKKADEMPDGMSLPEGFNLPF